MATNPPKKSTNYIEYKDGFPYAALTIPVELREKLGKRKYRKKLDASSPRKAQLEASSLVAGWKKEIALHKALLDDEKANPLLKILMLALDLRQALEEASDDASCEPDEHRASDKDLLHDYIEGLAFGKIQREKGYKAAKEFYGIAVGSVTPLEPFYKEWAKSKLSNYSLKTADSYRRDAKAFVDHFVNLESVSKKAMRLWIASLMEHGTDPAKPKPMTIGTLRDRFMCGVRHFHNYLIAMGLVDEEQVNPMIGVIPKEEKTKINLTNKGWIPFEPKDVAQIYQSIPKKDSQLTSVMAIGMFTGTATQFSGGVTQYYNGIGEPTGTSKTFENGTTQFYNGIGQPIGTVNNYQTPNNSTIEPSRTLQQIDNYMNNR